MSGVEVIGLILGVFPIITSGWSSYKDACRPLKDWWQFEQAFGVYMRQVVCEEVLFRQTLEVLLLPSCVESEGSLAEMCSDPHSSIWQDPKLSAVLEERMGPSYTVFCDTLNEMNVQVSKIRAMLGVGTGEDDWYSNAQIDWKAQYKRLKFCVKKSKAQKYCTKLAEQNAVLSRLVNLTNSLGPLRQQRHKSRTGVLLQKIRNAASGLYQALDHAWKCDCPDHRAILRLEQRPQEEMNKTRGSQEDLLQFRITLTQDHLVSSSKPVWIEVGVKVQTPHDITPVNSNAGGALKEIQENVKMLQLSKSPKTNGPNMGIKSISFAKSKQGESDMSILAPEISNLCRELRLNSKGGVLGKISHNTGEHFVFVESRALGDQEVMISSMDRVLGAPGNPAFSIWTLPTRLRLSVVIASSVLQLWGTPWMAPQFTKNWLYLDQNRSKTGMACVQNNFPKTRKVITEATSRGTHEPSLVDTREAMLQLAIVLLEVCMNGRLEDQPFRRKYMGPDGWPSDLTDRMTAMKWQEQAIGFLGPKFANVISRCLDCRFGLDEPDLSKTDFQQSVHANVVLPLEEISRQLS